MGHRNRKIRGVARLPTAPFCIDVAVEATDALETPKFMLLPRHPVVCAVTHRGCGPLKRQLPRDKTCAKPVIPDGQIRRELIFDSRGRPLNKPAYMNSRPELQPASPATQTAPDSEPDLLNQNIEAVLEFYEREEQKISRSQRALENISRFLGQPVFLAIILLFVALWTGANAELRALGMAQFDPPPFSWLQGILGLGALLTATVVLTRQNRLGKLSEQRAHLDLKVTLLTEQKAAKIIDMLEELRRDLPMVKDRHDPEAAALQQSLNPDQVLAALDEHSGHGVRAEPAAEAQDGGKE